MPVRFLRERGCQPVAQTPSWRTVQFCIILRGTVAHLNRQAQGTHFNPHLGPECDAVGLLFSPITTQEHQHYNTSIPPLLHATPLL
jgi:hypothetical protein